MKYKKVDGLIAHPEEKIVINHTTKIAEAFEAKGFEVTAIARRFFNSSNIEEYGITEYEISKDSKEINIRTTYRHNGTGENASTTIELLERTKQGELNIINTNEKVKITKDAGEKSINNKINKIIEKF